MSKVLVTGGTGLLGRSVVEALGSAGHAVSVLTRGAGPAAPGPPANGRRYGDLRTGAGLPDAVDGVDVVVHLASDPRHGHEVDVDGTARLTGAAAAAGCGHLVMVSIVGCDRVPFPYYRVKATAEEVALRGPVPASVLRATQFHDLVCRVALAATRGPVVVAPRGVRFAPVDVRDVADRLVRAVADGPAGRLPDLGGPDVLGLGDAAAVLAGARGRGRPRLLDLPAWGGFLRALAAGRNLPGPGADRGARTFAAWVAERRAAGALT